MNIACSGTAHVIGSESEWDLGELRAKMPDAQVHLQYLVAYRIQLMNKTTSLVRPPSNKHERERCSSQSKATIKL